MEKLASAIPNSTLDLPPFPVDGVNTHCLTLANHCHLKGVDPGAAIELIMRMGGNLRPGRTLKLTEVKRAVEKAYSSPIQSNPKWKALEKKNPKWPVFDQALADRIVADIGATVADIEAASPINLSRFARGRAGVAEYLVWHLFPGDPWICVGRSMAEFMTRRKSFFGFDPQQPAKARHDLHTQALIVPSPMRAQTGITQDGRTSEHTKDATGPRCFIVAEFDGEPDKDRQASLIVELARSMPLVMALESGGKSIHSFFYVADKDGAHTRRWFDYAVSLGADRALWTRSQFARMPGGTRHKPGDPTHGAFQRPFYFNPSAMGGTI